MTDPWSEEGGALGKEVLPPYDDRVVKFEPQVVGSGYRFDPDEILEAAKGEGFTNLVIVGENPDGSVSVRGASNAGESIILMERAKKQIIFGED